MIVKVNLEDLDVEFQLVKINLSNKNKIDVFGKNKKTLGYKLKKAIEKKSDRLHSIASLHLEKYKKFLNMDLGHFLQILKNENNQDYKLYLNKYGDLKYCEFKLTEYITDKGLYCYVVNNKIQYIGRSKKTFKERINEYGKITPYNCLIDGQATNCKVNAIINSLNTESVLIGFYVMNSSTDSEISSLEKKIIKYLNDNGNQLWNSQLN